MLRIAFLLCLVCSYATAKDTIHIDRIDPTDWYVGMDNPSLQLLLYGKDIRSAEVATTYEGVAIDSLVRLDSPNYLLVYLNIKDAPAGVMTLDIRQGKATAHVPYTLKEREKAGSERVSFSAADVLYMLMPDRFADGDTTNNDNVAGLLPYHTDRSAPSLRHGGDLEGIRQHLDYFVALGVTALWLTPVLENNAPDIDGFSTYHGYATTDYYRVDPRFGTNDDYRRLVQEAHERGLKVVMDMIFNHCGSYHPWLKDLPSADWFNNADCIVYDPTTAHVSVNDKYLQTSYKLTPIVDPYASDIDKRETVDGWFVPTMPDLNQRNTHLLTYLTQNSMWWIETVGIDGIRMDTYPYADATGMAQWMKELRREYPHFNVVGETWVTEPAYTATYQHASPLAHSDSNLPTVMDFSFYDKINMAKKEDTDDWWKGYNRIYNSLVYDYLYPAPASVMAFLDNHDTDRFLEEGHDVNTLKQALALLLTMRRIPQIYYGTEVLMGGTKTITDGNVRKDFMGGFPGDTRDCFTATGRTAEENEFFAWLQRLLHWRQHNPVIAQGTQKQFIPYNGIYVLTRHHEGSTVMTVINGRDSDGILSVARYAEVIGAAREAQDILTGSVVSLSDDVPLSPRQVLILTF